MNLKKQSLFKNHINCNKSKSKKKITLTQKKPCIPFLQSFKSENTQW